MLSNNHWEAGRHHGTGLLLATYLILNLILTHTSNSMQLYTSLIKPLITAIYCVKNAYTQTEGEKQGFQQVAEGCVSGMENIACFNN